MTAQQSLPRSTTLHIISGLVEVFTLLSVVNARDLFDQAIKEISELFVKINIALDIVKKYVDDLFAFVKSIEPQKNVELFLCALMVVSKLLGEYEFLQSYMHNNQPGEKFLELSSKCKERILKMRSKRSIIG